MKSWVRILGIRIGKAEGILAKEEKEKQRSLGREAWLRGRKAGKEWEKEVWAERGSFCYTL